jgi:hypothetical protein
MMPYAKETTVFVIFYLHYVLNVGGQKQQVEGFPNSPIVMIANKYCLLMADKLNDTRDIDCIWGKEEIIE